MTPPDIFKVAFYPRAHPFAAQTNQMLRAAGRPAVRVSGGDGKWEDTDGTDTLDRYLDSGWTQSRPRTNVLLAFCCRAVKGQPEQVPKLWKVSLGFQDVTPELLTRLETQLTAAHGAKVPPKGGPNPALLGVWRTGDMVVTLVRKTRPDLAIVAYTSRTLARERLPQQQAFERQVEEAKAAQRQAAEQREREHEARWGWLRKRVQAYLKRRAAAATSKDERECWQGGGKWVRGRDWRGPFVSCNHCTGDVESCWPMILPPAEIRQVDAEIGRRRVALITPERRAQLGAACVKALGGSDKSDVYHACGRSVPPEWHDSPTGITGPLGDRP
jgi:hypothetical protein